MTRAHVFCIAAGIAGGNLMQAINPYPVWVVLLADALIVGLIGWYARREIDWR